MTAIILKSFLPYKQKISVLTQHAGKATLIINRRQAKHIFSPGTIIRYKTQGKSSFVAELEVTMVPIPQMKTHMCWLHHLLEICYYFIPLGAPCADLFELVHYSLVFAGCASVFRPHFAVIKRACLVKLLLLLGFYPDKELVSVGRLFDNAVFVFLDSSNAEKVRSLHVSLSDVCDDLLTRADKWAWLCIQEHPHAAYFKTTSFLHNV